MKLNDAVQSLIDAQDWPGLVAYYWSLAGQSPYGQVLLVGVPLALILGAIALSITAPPATAHTLRDKPLPPVSTRGYKPRRTVYIALNMGNVTVDLQPTLHDTVHTVVGGVSGLGKSTLVLPLFDLPIGVLCVALDNTRPIAAKVRSLTDGVEWTNEPAWGVGLDILSGDARIVSEALVAGWPKTSNDTGHYRRIARQRLWAALETMDQAGGHRNIGHLAEVLLERSQDAEVDRACRAWASRLASLGRTMGGAFGTDLDLVQAMRDRQKVLLRLNRFLSPEDAPLIGGMLLVHARRVAQQAGVPFVLIVEEAGQMDAYQEHMVPLAQAGRDRGVPMVILTQNMSNLPLEVQNNVSVWVSFAQEARRELTFAAERLRLESEQLQREAFGNQGRGQCYVRAPGIPTSLVKVKEQRPVVRAPAPKLAGPRYGTPVMEVVEFEPQWGLPAPAVELPPAWIGLDKDRLRIWGKLKRTGQRAILWSPSRGTFYDDRGCLEWQAKSVNGDAGRPKSSIGRKTITVYVEVWQWARGTVPADRPTLDHLCDNVRCSDPEHLEPCTIAENNWRRSQRQAAFEAAGWPHGNHSERLEAVPA